MRTGKQNNEALDAIDKLKAAADAKGLKEISGLCDEVVVMVEEFRRVAAFLGKTNLAKKKQIEGLTKKLAELEAAGAGKL